MDVMNRNFIRRLHHHALTAVAQGVFVIDKESIIRYRLVVGPIETIPSAEELLSLVEALCP
jgi:alkyl hydroperoxide reductase subunit AhpC